MSARDCKVVQITQYNVKSHPNADSLSIFNEDGIQVVIKTDAWPYGSYALWCPPDSIIPDNIAQWNWAAGRVKVTKLRGVISDGVLLPIDNMPPQDVSLTEYYNIGHYEPPVESLPVCLDGEVAPPGYYPKYDVEGAAKLEKYFENKEVYVTEKLHGQNIGIVYKDNQLHVRSRNLWKRDMPNSLFWQGLYNTAGLVDIIKQYPNHLFFGEQIGHVKHFRYGFSKPAVRIFDVYNCNDKSYWNWDELSNKVDESVRVPLDYIGPFNKELIREISERDGHLQKLREGVVVKPLVECATRLGERLMCKYINPAYFNKS